MSKFSQIMLIKDSRVQLRAISEMLQPYYAVVGSESGEDIIAQLDGEQPDLLVLDNVLEGLQGYDVCRTIRRDPRYAYLPVVMVSSMDQPVDILEAFESGVNAYLTKPFRESDLLKVIFDFEESGVHIREERVLLIDDSPMILSILSRALKSVGFQVETAPSGEDGIRAALRRPPDLITVDLTLPGIDGFETIRKLREFRETQQVPIIMITSDREPETVQRALELGVCDYFTKPFQPEQLASYIEHLLSSRAEQHDETILVVEDDPGDRDMLQQILANEGYTVATARDGEEGLQRLTGAGAEDIDLVLCDVYMPRLSGIRMLEKLRNRGPARELPPFVFITAANKHKVAIECLRLGARDFISKPFDAIELKLRIRNHLR